MEQLNFKTPVSVGVNSIIFSPKLRPLRIFNEEDTSELAQVLTSLEVITHLTGIPFLTVRVFGEYPEAFWTILAT